MFSKGKLKSKPNAVNALLRKYDINTVFVPIPDTAPDIYSLATRMSEMFRKRTYPSST
jgi:hypothetical protein